MSTRSGLAERLKSFYGRRPLLVWAAVVLAPPAIMAALCLAWPATFWDGFVDRYYWTPLKDDESYNPVDTATYALLAVVCLAGLHELFRLTGTPFSPAMLASLVPFVLFGGLARALEDSELVEAPLRYLFITPIIYLLIALCVALPLFLYANRLERSGRVGRLVGVGGALAGMAMAYSAAYILVPGEFAFLLHPAWVFAAAGVGALAFALFDSRVESRAPLAMAVFGSFLLLCAVMFMARWPREESWLDAYGEEPGTHWWLLLSVPLGAVCVAGLAKAVGAGLGGRSAFARAMGRGDNVLLLGAQMLDGIATWVGIDFYGYSEKHVLPTALIEAAGGAWVMLPLKLGLCLLAIWLLDVVYAEDMQENPRLAGLVKLVIILVGVGPGSRDVFRLAMGV